MPRVGGCPLSEGEVEPASTNLCPVAREYPSRALGLVISAFPRCDCSIKERGRPWNFYRKSEADVMLNLFPIRGL